MKEESLTQSVGNAKSDMHNIPKPPDFDIKELKDRYYVDDEGNVRNSISVTNTKKDDIAGHLSRKGYIYIKYKGKLRNAHHIAWALYYDEWPTTQIDHIDGNKQNNSKDNLRAVSQAINNRNQGMSKANKTGVNGYYLVEPKRNLVVYWRVNRIKKSKTFADINEAEEYLAKTREQYGNGFIDDRNKVKSPHVIQWCENGKQTSKSFQTKEDALAFKAENDLRLIELYGYGERHGKAA